jgi:hypothetical protein
MMRAEERGRRVAPVYVRRLLVLLVIGCAHMFLLWYGDILHLYALMGFTLLLWRKRKDKTLVGWGAGLARLPLGRSGRDEPCPYIKIHAVESCYCLSVDGARDQALEVERFRHARQHRMIARLNPLLDEL